LGVANSTDTLSDLAATINAAGYGVTATYNATVGVDNANIVLTSADSSVTVSDTTLGAAGAGAGTAASLTGTPSASGAANSTTLATITGATTAAGNLVIGANVIPVTLGETIAQQAAAINAGAYGVTATLSTNQLTMTLTSADSAPEVITDAAGSVVTLVGTTASPYNSTGISGNVTDSSTGGGTGVLGLSGDNNGTNGVATISYSDAPGAVLTGTDLINQTDAQSALNDLNLAVSDASALDGYIGAQINTLTSIGQVISTQQENVVSAQNAIQATDYASATSNLSKYEILSQTGIAALAQANSVQQEVTKLLQ
jgi:flagellin